MFITLLVGLTLHAMQQTPDIGQRNDLVRGVVVAAVDEWSTVRRCQVDPEARSRISVHISASLQAMIGQEEPRQTLTRARVFAFLDDLSVSHGPRSEKCLVTADATEGRTFQIASFPRTGVLEVDGSVVGAPIYIDGRLEGYVTHAIVLEVGKHTWKTMKCEKSIEIKEDETRQVRCNRK